MENERVHTLEPEIKSSFPRRVDLSFNAHDLV